MSRFSAEIRRSHQWWNDLHHVAKTKAWADSARRRIWRLKTSSGHADVTLSGKQINYVIDELEGYAALRDTKHRCQVSCFERIWESEDLIDTSTRTRLLEGLDGLRLEKPPFNTTEALVDVIDPTLHCLVYGRTLVSQFNGRLLKPIPPPPSTNIYTVSPHFCLLPADAYIREDASTKFLSYINDLRPVRHSKLYGYLEALLAGFIPLYEHCLTDLHRNNLLTQRISGRCKYAVWEEPEPPEHSDDEEGWAIYERDMREWALNRPVVLPDVPEHGYSGGLENRKHRVTLRNRVVQIIVQASEIELTPQNPIHKESAWCVAGMQNERIIACGFHYLSSENVAEPFLQFRMGVAYPKGFSTGDTGATLRAWGIKDGDACHQYIGSVPIRTGLSVVFPNIYQHRETAFILADSSKAGRLSIVRFYLIDPDIKPIVSTAVVGPQQQEWVREALDMNLDKRLPRELLDKIVAQVEGLMALEEAVSYKKAVIAARMQFTEASNKYHFCIPFDSVDGP